MNLGILALTLPLAPAAHPAPVPLPPPVAAPFTFVKVLGPAGSRTTWYPGIKEAATTPTGALVGLRPGYAYRFEVAGVGERKDQTVYPSVEVLGSLIPRPGMNVADHPVPIVLSEEDIARVLEGRYLSKVYFLEDPEQAVNGPVPPGIPLEVTAATEYAAIKEARARGRLTLIVRVGERSWTNDELAAQHTPGTILFPGAKSIPVPACPPKILFGGIPLYDPLLGPAIPCEECFHDGGDHMRPLGVGRGNRVWGLDPSDTAMEFNTSKGKKVATSNRVCICVPRFAALRFEISPYGYLGVRGPQLHHHLHRPGGIRLNVPSGAVVHLEQPIGAIGQLRPSGILSPQIPVTLQGIVSRPTAVSIVRGVYVAATVIGPEELTTYPCALILQKSMDPPNPQRIGEEVTFYLRYQNPSNEPMIDVVISDSLTGRLEYIEGTAKSDRPATFTATPNEAGSAILRWAIDGKLLPGEKGVISFKARIK